MSRSLSRSLLRFLARLALCGGIPAACATRPAAGPVASQSGTATASRAFGGKAAGLRRQDGFVPLYVGDRDGRLLLELPRDSLRVLLFVSEATGLGSNPVGLDRGADGASYVARFDLDGSRVLLTLENWGYRSSAADNAGLARSVGESFPPSTVVAMPLVAAERGRFLVDAAELAYRDWLDLAGTLRAAGQGAYSVSRDRSSIYRPATLAFPANTEVDVALTLSAVDRPGAIVAAIAPDGRAFTVRQHLSLLPLPDSTYRPREHDPRVGYFGVTFKDYAQPIQASLERTWIARHRLARTNPNDPSSRIAQPIVYYIDRGIPEPVRSATVEGARWWERAFDAAGLKGAFRVADLPDGVSPLDARYNVVQWVNRNERGWSIGGSLGDPRTGEIIKGMARMDSHRARTDYNLYAGLMGADSAAADTAFVLARIRQVTAHEIGHTLGLEHNYIASTYERGSVMDYPPPRVRLSLGGDIDISQAYAVGPGAYDVWAIRWGYAPFPPGEERDSLRAIIAEGLRKGYLFLSDADARPEFAADPRTNLWDDASSASEFLRREMDVRRVAIRRFGERNVRRGEPLSLLQERFTPVYLMHRFAINAVAKTIGGLEYARTVRGDAAQATRPIDGTRQRAALAQLVAALRPEELAIPDTALTLLVPRRFGFAPDTELFASRARPAFDELGAARTLAQMIVNAVLQRDRAARLVQFAARTPHPLTLGETIDTLVAATWNATAAGRRDAALRRVTQQALADRLLALAGDTTAAPEVRAMAEYKIVRLREHARRRSTVGPVEDRAHWAAIAADYTRWVERREAPAPTPALAPPPGDPFGDW